MCLGGVAMPNRDRQPADLQTPVVPRATAAGSGSLPLIVAGLLAVVLVVGYFAMGIPVLKAPDEARAPEPGIDATVRQPAPDDPAAPAQPRP
jgi:hypothetical protein